MVLLTGSDERSAHRLSQDGHVRSLPLLAVKALLLLLALFGGLCTLIGLTVIIVYVGKSLLGVDLAEGDSALHEFLYVF